MGRSYQVPKPVVHGRQMSGEFGALSGETTVTGAKKSPALAGLLLIDPSLRFRESILLTALQQPCWICLPL